jgi:predicted nucleotidyltransferase
MPRISKYLGIVHNNERMLNKMNITPTSLTILSQLAEDPMREFYQREIAEEAKVSLGSANHLLKDLVAREIVILEKRGKMFFYKINLDNPVTRQFKILFNIMYLDGLVRELRVSCKRLVLFGSCADGTDVKESDIDLFILTQNRNSVLQAIRKHERKINRKVSPIILSPIEWTQLQKKDKPLYDNISKGLVLWQAE